MNSDKILCTFFQRRNTINDEYMKEFDEYINVIKSYVGETPIHPGLIKSNITKMCVKYTNDPTP